MKHILSLLTVAALSVQLNAQLASINEDFNDFTSGTTSLPQNGWEKISAGAMPLLYIDGTEDKYVQAYSLFAPNTPIYLVTPQIVAPNGTQTLTFKAGITTGSAGGGTLEVGLLNSNSSADGFTSISEVINLTADFNTITLNVPESASQYIAFKFIGSVNHAALKVDDIVLTEATMSNVDLSSKKLSVVFSNDGSQLKFVGNDVSNIQIFSINGALQAEGKVVNNTFNSTKLTKGVYVVVSQDSKGNVTRTKVLKK